MSLARELQRIAAAAAAFTGDGEVVAAVIPAEPTPGVRMYLCAFADGEQRSWLVLDDFARPVEDRRLVRDCVSIAALCELAEDSAAGGRPTDLHQHLEEVGRVEGREPGADALAALSALESALEEPPRVASSAYLDRIGAASRAVEQALGDMGASAFSQAMKQGSIAVEGLAAEVETGYKVPLS